VKEGDEVITSPNTFVASANCIVYCRAKPIFADIDPKTYKIGIGNRETYWIYNIVLKYNPSIKPSKLSISTDVPNIKFKKQPTKKSPENLVTVPFISKKKIESTESGISKIKLKIDGKIFLTNLINPSIKQFIPDKLDKNDQSVAFIYI